MRSKLTLPPEVAQLTGQAVSALREEIWDRHQEGARRAAKWDFSESEKPSLYKS